MTQNAGIAFRVGSSYKTLNPTCVLLEWPTMQILHLGWDLHREKLKPHMCTFGVAHNVGIAFRVGSSYKEA